MSFYPVLKTVQFNKITKLNHIKFKCINKTTFIKMTI